MPQIIPLEVDARLREKARGDVKRWLCQHAGDQAGLCEACLYKLYVEVWEVIQR